MSKRKAEEIYYNKDTEHVNTRSQYKRAKLNEEDQNENNNYDK